MNIVGAPFTDESGNVIDPLTPEGNPILTIEECQAKCVEWEECVAGFWFYGSCQLRKDADVITPLENSSACKLFFCFFQRKKKNAHEKI